MKIEKREREKIDIIINFILLHAVFHFISSRLVSFRFRFARIYAVFEKRIQS